jgi:glutaredoxin
LGGGIIVILILNGLVFGFAAGTIRANQGGTFAGGFWWGFLLGIIGLIVVVATKPTAAPAAAPAGPGPGPAPSPSPTAPRPIGASASNPKAVRECPHCKEAMRRDASVCPHCRRDSDAWRYWEGRWWSPEGTEPPVWYDEPAGIWRDVADIPAPAPDAYDLVVVALADDGGSADKVARIVAADGGERSEEIRARLADLPAHVLKGVGYATGEGARDAISRSGAAQVELRPHEATAPRPPPPTA